MRINVYVPDALAQEAAERFPDHNASRLFQEALRSLTGCDHDVLRCTHCGIDLWREAVSRVSSEQLFAASVEALEALMVKGGTVEGAIRVLFDVSRRHNVRLAFSRPLPRLTRHERAQLDQEAV